MPKSITFHSYKGGTGKTTIAANLAAILTMRGYKVALLDLDVYAPSLHSYFEINPRKWINDLLSDNAKIQEMMLDLTDVVKKLAPNSETKFGKLWVGFSNPQKEEVYRLEGGLSKETGFQIQVLRKFIELREDLMTDYDCDYVILDTSPGIRFWSINALAISDVLFLTLKWGDQDVAGTKQIAGDIFSSFEKFGAESYLLLNRVSGYCIPNRPIASHIHNGSSQTADVLKLQQKDQKDIGSALSKELSMDLASAIPCYCDIQFSSKEFMTALQFPDHPFSKQIERLATERPIKD